MDNQKYHLNLTAEQIIKLLTKQLCIKLQVTGKNIFFNCPFHDDRHPSFCFNPEYKIFRCFSCKNFNEGKPAGIVTFWSNYQRINAKEAQKEIAELVGLSLEENEKMLKKTQKEEEKDFFFLCCKIINNVYHYNLFSKKGNLVWQYLTIKRKIKEATIKDFLLGATIDKQQISSLIVSCSKLKKKISQLNFIWKINETGEIRDFFFCSNLLIFPVINEWGKVISWIARKITICSKEERYVFIPNYTNDFYNYRRSDILYNYCRVKQNDEKECFLVEGIFDVISLHQEGITNCVALLGTSFSNKQLTLLSNLKKKIIIFLDNDKAGEEATIKILVYLLTKKIDCEAIYYQQNDALDPDEICQKKKISQVINQRKNPFCFVIEYFFNFYDIENNPQRISLFVNKIFSLFNKCQFSHPFLIKKIIELTGWDREQIFCCLPSQNSLLTVPYEQILISFCRKKILSAERQLLSFCRTTRFCWLILDNSDYSFINEKEKSEYLNIHRYYSFSTSNSFFWKDSEKFNASFFNSKTALNNTFFLMEKIKQMHIFEKHQQKSYEKK